jgi:hypothetical protein
MKVNISYSVELDEVLANAYSLLKAEKQKFKDRVEGVNDALSEPFEDDTLVRSLQAIKQHREAAAKFDEKLAEISNILLGYAQIRYQQKAQAEQQTQQPNTEENEQV